MARLSFPKLYPDLPLPLIGYLLADGAALLWAAGCYLIGVTVYTAIMTLSVIANAVIATGRQLNNIVTAMQQNVSGLPFVGPNLRDDLNALNSLPRALISQGQDELVAIQHVALVLGIAVGGVPLLAMLLFYIPWRVRKTRGFRSLNRMLRKPGARAVSTTMQVLAGRAIYTLPYDHLLRYSSDPVAEWREGRHYNLARATMAQEGLDVRRYLRRVEGLAPVEPPRRVHEHKHELPTIDDEERKM